MVRGDTETVGVGGETARTPAGAGFIRRPHAHGTGVDRTANYEPVESGPRPGRAQAAVGRVE